MTTVQLTIFLDTSGNLHAEAPGSNGSRKKIDLFGNEEDWKAIILAELQSQHAELRAKQRAELQTKQLENIKYVVERHNERLAKRVWPSELVFNRSLQRQLAETNLGPSATVLSTHTGLTNPVPKAKKPTAPPATTRLKIPA